MAFWMLLRRHLLSERRPPLRDSGHEMTAPTRDNLIFAVLLLLAACCSRQAGVTTPASDATSAKGGKPMNDRVLEWLNEAPFDNPERAGLKPNFSYEEWFAKGRSIPGSVDVLAQLLQSEDPSRPSGIGARAAYALGWIGDRSKRVVDALLTSLGSKDTGLRMEAASALGHQGGADVLHVLEALLTNENEELNVRANACISIGRLRVPSSEPLLRRILQDKNKFLARSAQEALRLLNER